MWRINTWLTAVTSLTIAISLNCQTAFSGPGLVPEETKGAAVAREWTNSITQIAYSPDGQFIGLLSTDGTLKLQEIQSRQINWVIKAHSSPGAFAFAPDGKSLITVGIDVKTTLLQTTKLWNVRDGTLLWKHVTEGENKSYRPSRTLAFARSGALVALAGSTASTADGKNVGGIVEILDTSTGRRQLSIEHKMWNVSFLAFSQDSTSLFAWGEELIDGNRVFGTRKWDAKSGNEQSHWSMERTFYNAATISPDGATLATGFQVFSENLQKSTPNSSSRLTYAGLALRDPVTGNIRKKLGDDNAPSVWGHLFSAQPTFSPDGKLVACLIIFLRAYHMDLRPEDMKIRIWSIKSGKLQTTITNKDAPFTAFAFSPSVPEIATIDSNGVLKFWRTDAQTALWEEQLITEFGKDELLLGD